MQPVNHELDLLMQDILTYASWGLTVVILVVAYLMGRKERTPFYVLVALAAGLGAFGEPLYDKAFDLYFYTRAEGAPAGTTDGIFSHFTAFDIPQPIWTHSGYVVLYAAAAIFGSYKLRQGKLTGSSLFLLFGLELTMSCVFEMTGINGGAYSYWGAHELRIFHYPLVIGVLEAAQVVCFTVAAVALRERVKSPVGLLGLLVLFPVTFFGVNFGAGFWTIVSLHLEDGSATIVTLASLLSIGCCLLLVRGASLFLPKALEPAPVVQERQSVRA